MKDTKIENTSPFELVDIRDVDFDYNIPFLERKKHYIKETKGNPNSFKCGASVVLMRYKESYNINDRLAGLIESSEKH